MKRIKQCTLHIVSPELIDMHSVYNNAEPGAPASTVNKPDADSVRVT
jgi:hypothetical protein